MSFPRLLRTVRRLKAEQVWGRALHLANFARPDLRPPPQRRARNARWTSAIEKHASFQPPSTFTFLNHTAQVREASDWRRGQDLLWLYNLHYFDELGSAVARSEPEARSTLIARWLAENPPAEGVGWAPYPTSLRLVNWIKAALGGFSFEADAIASLAVQARWLAAHLERHLLGNHLLANAKALAFAGLWFEGDEADAWLRTALDILAEELPEQILSDGGHFERSPMYQAIILEDLLDLFNLAQTFALTEQRVFAELPERVTAMCAWLAAMSHPDGRIAFFNDAAFGVAAEPADLARYAERLGLATPAAPDERLIHLEASGYVRLTLGPAVAILDVAPIGPDYLPGHAHADTLSFEMSLGRDRLIVNGGVSVYGSGPQRQRERATRAHSTVELAGENSSEVWAGFRVGRRARVRDLSITESNNVLEVSAAHDGYAWLPDGPLHRRFWRMTARGLHVRDVIDGSTMPGVARFHLPPQIAVGPEGQLTTSSGQGVRWRTSAPADVSEDQWAPEFGVRVASRQIEVPFSSTLDSEFSW